MTFTLVHGAVKRQDRKYNHTIEQTPSVTMSYYQYWRFLWAAPAKALFAWALLLSHAHSATTFDNTNKYAWSGNTGWISFRHDAPISPNGITIGEFFLLGYAYSPNIGWIDFGDGTPSNGQNYSNSGNDHGVNHDGLGKLSGYAYSANAGWINFGWAGTAKNEYRPVIDLQTGQLSGYAYGANIGWINLGTDLLTTQSMAIIDSDKDGISDPWEILHFGRLNRAGKNTDQDKDGESDYEEFIANTNPNDAGDYLRVISQSYNGGLTQVTLQFTTVPGRLYRIEHSPQLVTPITWTNSSLGTFIPSSGATTIRVVTFSATSKEEYFFRIIAVRPLTP